MNKTIGQLDLIDIYKPLHPITKYTFFSSVCVTFTKYIELLRNKSQYIWKGWNLKEHVLWMKLNEKLTTARLSREFPISKTNIKYKTGYPRRSGYSKKITKQYLWTIFGQ